MEYLANLAPHRISHHITIPWQYSPYASWAIKEILQILPEKTFLPKHQTIFCFEVRSEFELPTKDIDSDGFDDLKRFLLKIFRLSSHEKKTYPIYSNST